MKKLAHHICLFVLVVVVAVAFRVWDALKIPVDIWRMIRDVTAVAVLLAVSASAQPAPVGLYTLKTLAWDGPGTNWQVMIRTQTNALPVGTFEVRTNRAACSNLQYGATYYLSVKAQSNGVWSAESTNYVWPHAREDYATYWMIDKKSHALIPGSISTVTNGPTDWAGRTLKVSVSNNITPYLIPQ